MSAVRLAVALAALSAFTSCGSGSTTSPSSTTSTSTSSGSPQTEFFSGTIWPGSESSYAFTVTQAGTVTETLASVTQGGHAASDATLTIGFGIPSGKGCARSAAADTAAELSAQLTADAPEGTHCADVSAPPDAPAPLNFVLRIVHP